MEQHIKQQALEWLFKQLKNKKHAQTHAEQRHKAQAENGHCLECELRNIQKSIAVIEWLIDRAMEYEIPDEKPPECLGNLDMSRPECLQCLSWVKCAEKKASPEQCRDEISFDDFKNIIERSMKGSRPE